MQIAALPTIEDFAFRAQDDSKTRSEERGRIENLLMDERPPLVGVTLYAKYLSGIPVADGDDWQNRHNNFVTEELEIGQEETSEPWTFRADNVANHLPLVDRRINLIRVEDVRWPCDLSHITFEELQEKLKVWRGGDAAARAQAGDFLQRFLATWNEKRDKRPLFATTELEVDDLLADTSNSLAERLRDRLGLGHYSPIGGSPPIPVLIMRYPLEESLGDNRVPAVPTLLDGKLNDHFFPSPFPGTNADPIPGLGHSLNLAPVISENDYRLGVELLHPHFDYRLEHFFWSGHIANPVTMPLERARSFHLPWLRLQRDRDDFGAGVVGVAL
ncbi:MAG: hypothetical protein WAZ34_11250 [Rhodocyclaceae bacterium]